MVEWIVSDALVDFPDALAHMEDRAALIAQGQADEALWLLEHPALYTAGTSAKSEDLLMPERFPVHQVGRGGQYTYHGPGQRVVYTMINVKARGGDVRAFVKSLENWIIAALAEFGLTAHIREGRIGVWIERPEKPNLPNGEVAEDKIAAIGIRIRRGVSFYGLSVNVDPELDHFGGIVPCGIQNYGVTSLVDLGLPVSIADLDVALQKTHPFA